MNDHSGHDPLRQALAAAFPPPPGPRPAAEFWAEFRGRAPAAGRTAVTVATPPVRLFLAAAAAAVLVCGVLFLTRLPPGPPEPAFSDCQVLVPCQGLFILDDAEAADGAILWVVSQAAPAADHSPAEATL